MRTVVVVLLAVAGGFVGGFTCVLIVSALNERQPPAVARARTFELVDENGQVISYWGTDKARNVVLAFGVRRDRTFSERRVGVDLRNPTYQTYAIGLMSDDTPFLTMRGPDGKARVNLLLSLYGKPFLVMSDQMGSKAEVRLSRHRYTEARGRYLVTHVPVRRCNNRAHGEQINGKTLVQGNVFVRKDKVPYP